MSSDQQSTISDEGRFSTARPTFDPVVIALSSDDPSSSFLELMRGLLDPGPWHQPIDDGFEWTAHRLPHAVRCFRGDRNHVVAVSTIILVEGADEMHALAWSAYLNQRSFGGAVWYDNSTSTLRITSAAYLDVTRWWNAYLFAMIVPRLVGICERLAPRLAEWTYGRVPEFIHPKHGRRNTADQFVDEWAVDTYAPEAGLGLWWSGEEVQSFRRVLRDAIVSAEGEVTWTSDAIEGTVLATSMGGRAVVPLGEGQLTLTTGETDHPDFGLGLEVLLSSSVQFSDRVADGGNPTSIHGLLVANDLNRILASATPAPLTLAGWTLWDNQLHLATYVQPEVVRSLQSAASPTVGEVVACVVQDCVLNADPLSFVLDRWDQQDDFEYRHIDDVTWAGVNQNGGMKSLLVDESEVVPAVIAGLPLNTLFDEPIELEGDIWALQHSKLLMTMGIFNPLGPSVGSLELAIDYNLQRGLLLERTRHPFLPSLRLWTVIDRDGFDRLPVAVEAVIERMQWSSFEWARVHDTDESMRTAIENGLLAFAEKLDRNLKAEAEALIDGAGNPWIRLDHRYRPSGALEELDGVPDEELWLSFVTDERVEDGVRAYIRSAWHGAVAFVREPNDPTAAERWIKRIEDEVQVRRRPDWAGEQNPS